MRSPLIFLILVNVACGSSDKKVDLLQYKNGRQLLNLNGLKRSGEKWMEPHVSRISPDSLIFGEEFNAKIFLDSSDINLVAAYFDCKTIEEPAVDTTINAVNQTRRLDGCQKSLVVKNDTVYLAFKADHIGLDSFPEITLLTRDHDNIFRTQRYAFSYRVLPN